MSFRLILFVVVALLGLSAGVIWSQHEQDERIEGGATAAESMVGQRRPPYTIGASDGQKVSASDFDGKVVLINFWATWCAPCREEMPMLVDVQNAYASQGLEVVGIALDDVEQARAFAAELGVSYTVLVGGADVMAAGVAYGNRTGMLPYTVLVDRAGVIRWVHLGVLEREGLESEIKQLL